jgi:hypothetical protein
MIRSIPKPLEGTDVTIRSKTVVDNSPWVVAVGSIPLLLSFECTGSLASLLATLSLLIDSAVLGALLTHYPD